MKLHSSSTEHLNTVTAYGTGYIEINQTKYPHPVICSPTQKIQMWACSDVADIQTEHLEQVCDATTELILVGTGAKQRFIHPSVIQPLLARRIAVECMDSLAAARTYNILMAEDRQVILLYLPF